MIARVKTAVAMLVFNRPTKTAQVLEAVRSARPARLLVVADGPRPGHPEDVERCAAVRSLFDHVDWDCQVEREFAPVNLGCGNRVSSGIDWVFSQVEEAIILEDDCLPRESFFPFCDELLERYRNDPRVMAITGDNFQGGRTRGSASYYFSRYMHVWGWASWRRAWSRYDVGMSSWAADRDRNWLRAYLGDPSASRVWESIFQRAHSGRIGTWDFQWMYAIWSAGGLVATPNVNMVLNIGAGEGATHTTTIARQEIPAEDIELPLVHPAVVERDRDADDHVQHTQFPAPPLYALRRALARVLGR